MGLVPGRGAQHGGGGHPPRRGLLGGGEGILAFGEDTMQARLCQFCDWKRCVAPGGTPSRPGDTPGHAALSEVPIGNSAASGAEQQSVPVLGCSLYPTICTRLQPIPGHPSPARLTASITPCARPQTRHCMPTLLAATHSTARNVVNVQC